MIIRHLSLRFTIDKICICCLHNSNNNFFFASVSYFLPIATRLAVMTFRAQSLSTKFYVLYIHIIITDLQILAI